jgi:glycosyltransferase involved in cell wall biosynthesis
MHAGRGFSRQVEHLPYFIHPADEDWQNPGPRPQERPYFLFVGRLEVIKGVHTLFPLWKEVPDCDLLIVGTGQQEGALRKLAAENPNIKFLGPKSQLELGNLYFHALATIVPSITYETFGIIIVESFARKTPVIVRDLGALPEVVEDSHGGFIYKTDEELLAAIQQLAAYPELRAELGERGYCAFQHYWSKEAHLRLYFDYLNRIAQRKFGCIPWEKG